MNCNFVLTGVTPLLMHADNVLAADELEASRKAMKKGTSKAGDDRSPAWSWHSYLYHDHKNLTWPSENLMVALRSAAATVTYSRQKSFKELSQSGLQIPAENLEFRTPKGQIGVDFIAGMKDLPFMEQSKKFSKFDPDASLFVKRVRINTSKHVRVRPRFQNWSVSGVIVIKDDEITFDRLKEFFDIAGVRVGMGDWRPSSKTPGNYGTFVTQLSKAK